MAVHKIGYYAHGWYIADQGVPLIVQEFEAWRDGPVQRLVWDSLKVAGKTPVATRATEANLATGGTTISRADLASDEFELLSHIVDGYGPLHAYELSDMTHEKGGPWDQIYNAPGGKVTLGMRIPHRLIRDHFLSYGAQKGRSS